MPRGTDGYVELFSRPVTTEVDIDPTLVLRVFRLETTDNATSSLTVTRPSEEMYKVRDSTFSGQIKDARDWQSRYVRDFSPSCHVS